MTLHQTPLRWEIWSQDPRVRFARSNRGIQVEVPGHDGWPRKSPWLGVIDEDVDKTVHRLLLQIGYARSDSYALVTCELEA